MLEAQCALPFLRGGNPRGLVRHFRTSLGVGPAPLVLWLVENSEMEVE